MRVLILSIPIACSLCAASCNTAIGVSRDIRGLGEGMENVFQGRDFNDPGVRSTPPPPPPPSAM